MRSRLCFVTISLSFAPDRGAWALSAFGLFLCIFYFINFFIQKFKITNNILKKNKNAYFKKFHYSEVLFSKALPGPPYTPPFRCPPNARHYSRDHAFFTYRMHSNSLRAILRQNLSTNQPFLSPVATFCIFETKTVNYTRIYFFEI